MISSHLIAYLIGIAIGIALCWQRARYKRERLMRMYEQTSGTRMGATSHSQIVDAERHASGSYQPDHWPANHAQPPRRM